MRKRILCAMFALLMVVTLLPIVAGADETSVIDLAFTQRETAPGATEVSVGVDMDGNPGFVSATIPIKWDNNVLHLKSVTPSTDILETGWCGMSMEEYTSNGTYYLSWNNDIREEGDFTTTTGCLAELVFEIVDPSVDTSTQLQFDMTDSIANIMNFEMGDLNKTNTVTANPATITVTAQTSGGDTPNPVPSDKPQLNGATLDKVRAGESISLPIKLVNNPGVSSIIIDVYYDSDTFEYDSSEYGTAFTKPISNPMTDSNGNAFVRCTWVDGVDNINGDLVFVALKFNVKEGAEAGSYKFAINYDPENIYMVDANYDYENVEFVVVEGVVNIVDYVPGDINGDGSVNAKDQGRLLQYLAGLPVTLY